MILFATLSYQIIFLLMTSKPSCSEDIDFLKIEENLLNTLRDIRIEVMSLQTEIKQVKITVNTLCAESDFNKVEENLISTMKDIRPEIEGLNKNLNEVNNLVHTLSNTTERFNVTGSFTNFVLEKISPQYEEIKEILSKKEKPFENETHSKNTDSFGTNEPGKESSCTDLLEPFLSIVNNLFNINTTKYEPSHKRLEDCWGDLFLNITGSSSVMTSQTKGIEAAEYCWKNSMKPFIPRTQEEFKFYIGSALINTHFSYPINDIKREKHVVLLDGTDYENSNYKLEKWKPYYENGYSRDCVKVNIFGEALWYDCEDSLVTGICLRI